MKCRLLQTAVLSCLAIAVFLGQLGCHRQQGIRIGFVVTTLSNPYFVTMVNAAKVEAAKTPGVQLIVQAPDQAVQVGQQIDDVDNLIAQHVDVLCIVPADSKGILPAIAKANQAGIPVLILDNRIDQDLAAKEGVHTVTYIGSDNFVGGKMAGQYMISKLPHGGDVAILEGVSGVDAAIQRKAGFLEALASAPQLHVVASQPADWDREKGLNVFQNMLQAHPNIKGVFGSNDEMALGALQAIQTAGKGHKIVIVGYDAIQDSLSSIRNGEMDATIAQMPDQVGQLGVQYALQVTQGKSIPLNIPTEVRLITRESALQSR
jgi:ribose transport system substrate-binding protein